MKIVGALSTIVYLFPIFGLSWSYQVPTTTTSRPSKKHPGIQQQKQQEQQVTSLSRRTFVGVVGTVALTVSTPETGAAAAPDIKVTPLAHTFITASGAVKPIRENDATRLFTNAKVVYLFQGKDASPDLATEIVDLTAKRKAGEGPGVTPGNVEVLSSSASMIDFATSLGKGNNNVGTISTKNETQDAVVAAAKSMKDGNVLLVGPIPSGGTIADGKVLAETATSLGTFVGGKTGNGVISVLLDGPRSGLQLEEGGYPTSELLWYSLPPRS